MREPLDWEKETEEVLVLMSEGDPEALHVLTEVITKNAMGPTLILDLDDMNIRGKQITAGVKDVCHGNIKTFFNLVFQRSPWLCTEINKEIWDHRAVPKGGSDMEPKER